MSVYAIYDIEITDHQTYARYKPGVARSAARHGGEILVATQEAESLEGSWKPTWLVVLRFPTRDALLGWLDSDDYRPLRELREAASVSKGVLAPGRLG